MNVIEKALKKAHRKNSPSSTSKDKNDLAALTRYEVRDPSIIHSKPQEIAQMAQPGQYDIGYMTRQKIIYPNMGNKRIFNAFRELRTKIFKKVEQRNRILMITPLSPGGGGSFIALNLASSITLDESKTALLVDCNLHNPSLDRLVLTDNECVGLIDYLQNSQLTPSDIIKPTGITRLRVIPTGQNTNLDAEPLSNFRLVELFSELKSRYRERTIIVDAPCVSNRADTTILSELCDDILLVLPYAKTTQQGITKALAQFDKDKIIGIAFNNVP